MIRFILLVICVVSGIFLGFQPILKAQPILRLHPTLNSIGIEVELPTQFDTSHYSRALLTYHQIGRNVMQGYVPTKLTIDSNSQFRGSAFQLQSNTSYVILVELHNQQGEVKAKLFDTVTTLSIPKVVPTSIVRYVSPQGNGNEYTFLNPGNLQILLSGEIECGTTIILKGGRYHIGEMQMNLTKHCTENSPVIFMSAPNETPILDGSDDEVFTWTRTPEDSSIYRTTIPKHIEYNALMMIDSIRLYPYPFLKSPDIQPNYPALTNLGYDVSGFYRKGNLVYCKTLDKRDPNLSKVKFSNKFTCLTINGNGMNNYLIFKGITFECYGKGKCDFDVFSNPSQCYPSRTLYLVNVNDVLIDSCTFTYTNFPITFNGSCDRNIVQRCTITDQTGWWSHGAFKQSRESLFLEPGSYGRYLENSGISIFPNEGGVCRENIIRDNTISGVVSGISVGSSSPNYRIYDTDISDNTVSYCYDGIDVTSISTGAGCINSRVWNNEIHHCPVGISLILPQWGPTTIFRNVIHHISERKNHNYDVFFADCDNTVSNKIWGTGLKVNTGAINLNPGVIHLFHNTFHSVDEIGFPMYLWRSTWKQLISKNNIFYSTGKSSLFFDDIADDTLFSFDSDHDNFWNTTTGKISILQPKNGIPLCEYISSPIELEKRLKFTTNSSFIRLDGVSVPPNFTNSNDFHLNQNSTLIDKAVAIPGINENFLNSAPDIGAFESLKSSSVADEILENDILLYPNPFSTTITLSSIKPLIEISIVSVTGTIVVHRKLDNVYSFTIDNFQSSGLMFVTLYFSDGCVVRKKIISIK